MSHFLSNQIDFCLFFQGFLYFSTAVVILTGTMRTRSNLAWKYLFWFCLIFGIKDWVGSFYLNFLDGDYFTRIELVLATLAFLAVLEFGRKGCCRVGLKINAAVLYALFLFIGVLGACAGPEGYRAVISYVLLTPGFLLSAYSIYRDLSSKSPDSKRIPAFLVILSFLYIVLWGIIVPKSAIIPAVWINETAFEDLFKISIEYPRTVVSFLFALFLWLAYAPKRGEHNTVAKYLSVVYCAVSCLFLMFCLLSMNIRSDAADHNDQKGIDQ